MERKKLQQYWVKGTRPTQSTGFTITSEHNFGLLFCRKREFWCVFCIGTTLPLLQYNSKWVKYTCSSVQVHCAFLFLPIWHFSPYISESISLQSNVEFLCNFLRPIRFIKNPSWVYRQLNTLFITIISFKFTITDALPIHDLSVFCTLYLCAKRCCQLQV